MTAQHSLLFRFFCSITLLICYSVSARPLHLSSFDSQQGLSQNSINCSINDAQGFTWFATQGGLNRFDGYEFKRFKATGLKGSISGNWVTACLQDENNQLWFATASKGLNRLDTTTGQFNTYTSSSSLLPLSDDKIWSMAFDKFDNLWLGHEQGKLTMFNLLKQQVEHFQIKLSGNPNIVIRDIVTSNNQLWLATSHGLIKFNSVTKQFEQHATITSALWHINLLANQQLLVGAKHGLYLLDPKNDTTNEIAQFNDVWITDSLIDSSNNLWITSYGKGIYFLEADKNIHQDIVQYRHDAQLTNSLKSDYLLSVYQDPQGIIWIGSDGFGVQRYNPSQQQFSHQTKTLNADSLSHNFIRAIIKRSNGQLWVGTRDGLNLRTENGYKNYKSQLPNSNIFALHEDNKQQLWVGTYGGGLLKYQQDSDDFAVFSMQSHQLSSNRVYAIASDGNDILWLGSNQGLTRFDPSTGSVRHFQHDPTRNSLANNTVFTLAYDHDDNALWIGTRAGLNKLDIDTEHFTLLNDRSSSVEQNALSHNMVTSLLLDNKNTIWVGTMQGLNKVDKQTFAVKHITEQHGLANDNIFDILADKQGYLWLATNGGLSRYQPHTSKIQQFLPEQGIQHQSFILGASFQAADGELYFGGINGFNHFYPEQLYLTHTPPTPVLTELLLNNQAIETRYFDQQSDLLINATNTLSLPQSSGVIGFKFSALQNPASPNHYQYGYKLAGFDEQFLYTDASLRQVNYPQLPAGQYELLIKAKDQYGQWSQTKSLLALTVVPPWWQSPIAYVVYFLAVLSVAWSLLNAIYKRKLAEQDKQKEVALNKLKDQFLDNISHELKTPLSLILAPVSQLQQQHQDTQSQTHLASIKRNSQRLLELINQLLQLSKRPSTAVYTVSPYSLARFLTELTQDFAPLFAQKNLQFSFQDNDHLLCATNIAPNHAHSIFSNLINNALKYTPEGGSVSVSLTVNQQQAIINITDTGIGIAVEDQHQVLKRFTRVASIESGSGIGLTLVKQLVEAYGGEITLHSEIGKGSCFSVSLPVVMNTNQSKTTLEHRNAKQTLLIVEDNHDMTQLLLSLFNQEFNCLCAADGQHAISLCQDELPDLIISDVMMPVMDGYQLLAKLRENPATSHVPVLLLSAKADTQSRLKGLDLLADDFLSKPFEPTLLISRVKSLISLRQLLNQHLTAQLAAPIATSPTETMVVQNKDYCFTEKLKQVVLTHYQDEGFSVEQLAAAMCMSTRALQLKMKSLYSLTPSDYLRNTRIELAAKQLINSSYSIGQVAQNNGFSSQSYFARCFKVQYGISPKQYREKYTKQADFRVSE